MSTTTTWPLTIEVAGLPPSPNRRMNWQAGRRIVKPMADTVAWQARAIGLPRPLERAHVVATLTYQRGPVRDWDNCVSSLKEVADALVTGGLLVSDAPAHLQLEVVQVVGRERGVLLEVCPAQAP
jgi:Holliday junction resolvase RusA-like endonuclease